jgi:hypothetical protein
MQKMQRKGVLMIRFVRDRELLAYPTAGQVNQAFDALLSHGVSTHSKHGLLLLPLLNRLEEGGFSYTLIAKPNKGYIIKYDKE